MIDNTITDGTLLGPLDWEEAGERLECLIKIYGELPSESRWFGLNMLRKLRRRYNCGERTEELYEKIMACE